MILKWLPSARQDYHFQLAYVARDNVAAAIVMEDEVTRQTALLRDHSHLGVVGREPGTRELFIARTPYVAIYIITQGEIRIVAFKNSSQEWFD